MANHPDRDMALQRLDPRLSYGKPFSKSIEQQKIVFSLFPRKTNTYISPFSALYPLVCRSQHSFDPASSLSRVETEEYEHGFGGAGSAEGVHPHSEPLQLLHLSSSLAAAPVATSRPSGPPSSASRPPASRRAAPWEAPASTLVASLRR